MKKLLAILLALIMMLAMIPAFAEGEVAQIGEKKYATLDEAINEAAEGDTIVLLADCVTDGMNLEKDLSIDGGTDKHIVRFTKFGIALWGKSLMFKNCKVVMDGIHSTPYKEWNWMTICARKDASLTLDNADMIMDDKNDETPHYDDKGGITYGQHAIYFCSNNKLNIVNGSMLTIKNYKQDALEWDGGDDGYNVNITNSTFTSDHNRSGFSGTFTARIDNSKVDVINSIGNGSNGSHFEIENGSAVNFSDNNAHGLSTGRLTIDNSTVTANGNGGNGVHANGTLIIRNKAVVEIKNNECSISSKWTIPGALYVAGAKGSNIDETSTVTIKENKGSGILLKDGSLNIEEGAKLTVMNNIAEKLEYGGGANVRGDLTLPSSAVFYNNHAAKAGDDIYNAEGASITFGNVGSNWILDDCNHTINGWYEDAEGNRWNSTYDGKPCIAGRVDHAVRESDRKIEDMRALKAAHDAQTTPPEPTPTPYIPHHHDDPVPVVVVVPPKSGDMPLWYGIARFLGLVK
ncbi:MAG: hypothetical protein PUC76_03685 [Clostridia bacterium]|nr:hypothetical protein [Clostridia bacterium]